MCQFLKTLSSLTIWSVEWFYVKQTFCLLLSEMPKSSFGTFLQFLEECWERCRARTKMSLWDLCFAVVCDCGLTHFRLKMMIMSSSVRLLLAVVFLNICTASSRRWEWKRWFFIASDTSGCILSIVWKRSLNNSCFSFLPSNISVSVFNGLNNVEDVWGRFWDTVPAIALARLLMELPESEFCLCGVWSTISNVLLGEMFGSVAVEHQKRVYLKKVIWFSEVFNGVFHHYFREN